MTIQRSIENIHESFIGDPINHRKVPRIEAQPGPVYDIVFLAGTWWYEGSGAGRGGALNVATKVKLRCKSVCIFATWDTGILPKLGLRKFVHMRA